MPIPACFAWRLTVSTSHCSLLLRGCSMTCTPMPRLAIIFDMASEMNEPPKPITADMTSRACRLRSTPFSASMPSMPKIWNTTLISTRMAALVARNRTIRIMSVTLKVYRHSGGSIGILHLAHEKIGTGGKFSSAELIRRCAILLAALLTALGGDLASTWVAKPEVHAEVQRTSLIHLQKLSCQRRQLRTRCLNPSRVPSDWSRACASGSFMPLGRRDTQASILTRSR